MKRYTNTAYLLILASASLLVLGGMTQNAVLPYAACWLAICAATAAIVGMENK